MKRLEMSCRSASFSFGLVLVALSLGGLWLCRAAAADRPPGKTIEFSEPKSPEVLTNLNELGSRKDSLRQLEEDLYRPLQGFSPRSSLDGVFAPPARPPGAPVIQSKRVRELLERRKNWIFMTPEDLTMELTPEEIFKLPQYGEDGQEQKRGPSLERYYQNMERRRAGGMKPGQLAEDALLGPRKQPVPGDESGSEDDSDLPSGVRESVQRLKKLGADSDSTALTPGPSRSSFSDLFGLGGPGSLPSQNDLERKKVLQELYGATFFSGYTLQSPMAPGLLDASPPGQFNPANGLPGSGLMGGSSTVRPAGYDPLLGTVSPTYVPSSPQDLNARVLNAWNPDFVPPKPEPPKTAPPAPTFLAPRRQF